jgi:hypothetical protein
MKAPRMPGHTCPAINKLKKRIEAAYKIAKDSATEEDAEDLKSNLRAIAHELMGESDALEELRDANIQLRNCAEYWEEEALRLQSAN